MRKLLVLLTALTLPSLATAKKRPRVDPRLTFVEDEPMAPMPVRTTAQQRRADPADIAGTRMDAAIRAPEVGRVAATAETATRGPASAMPAQKDDGAASGDAFAELVARQMRKNQLSIDACIGEAVRRRPSAAGTVELTVVVADKKIKSVHVSNDNVHDVDFDACLVKAGQGWKLQLASARFVWPVSLSPSASR
jgi:hypothetical protein